MAYEVNTIGALATVPKGSAPARVISGLSDLVDIKEYVKTPVLVGAGVGVVVGLLLGALLFGGARRG